MGIKTLNHVPAGVVNGIFAKNFYKLTMLYQMHPMVSWNWSDRSHG